jgi:hypothetical protein
MAPRIATPGPPSTVAVADVNGDGKPDLVFTLAGNSSADPVVGPSLNVMLGNGDGSYQPARRTVLDPDPSAFVGPPLLADLDGDGDLDVVIKSADVQLVLGDGQGNFTLGDHFAAPGGPFRLGDLDRDGNVDIALTGNGVTLVFGTGGGNFAAPISLDTTSVYQALEIADINGDHIPDLVVVGSSLAVFRGRGDRTFEAPVKATPAGDDGLHGLAVGDLDADGFADIVTSGLVSSTGTATVETWLGAADGSLTRRGQLSIGADHRTDLPPPTFVPVLAVGNFDRDTMLDVATAQAIWRRRHRSQPVPVCARSPAPTPTVTAASIWSPRTRRSRSCWRHRTEGFGHRSGSGRFPILSTTMAVRFCSSRGTSMATASSTSRTARWTSIWSRTSG